MACNLATTQANACSSGIGKETNPIALLRIIAQNLAETSLALNSSNTATVAAIQARACTSGIGYLTDENALLRIFAQNLCSLVSPVVTCPTLTLSGAGTASANQSYSKTSDVLYTGNSDPTVTVQFNSSQQLWHVNASGTDIYFQYGTEHFPADWLTENTGINPAPTGVCS